MNTPTTATVPTPAVAAPGETTFISAKVSFWGGIACVVVPLLIWFAPLALAPEVKHALAVTAFIIIAWVTEAMDHAMTGLVGCFLYWALGVAEFSTAFSGFVSDTPWFLLGALLFGATATKSGLAKRLSYTVMAALGHTYSRVLLGLIISDFLLTFLVPSGMARVVIMASIAIGLLEVLGLGPGSNAGRGMFIILTYTATIFDKMIIAGAAAITARGLIEQVGGVQVLWSQWAIAYLPCDAITIFVAWRLTLWMYPPERDAIPGGEDFLKQEVAKLGPLSALEKRAALVIGAAILLWFTDFLHHLPAPMIGLGAGLVATLPFMRILTIEDVKKVNLMPLFFVGAALSMGAVLRETGALNLMTDVMMSGMKPWLSNVWSSTLVLYWTAFLYHFFLASEISMLSTSLPILMTYAKDHGLNPLALGMVWTFGAGGKIFVYQSSVLIVGYSYGFFSGKDLIKVGFALTVVEALILLFLVPLYWPLIGIQ